MSSFNNGDSGGTAMMMSAGYAAHAGSNPTGTDHAIASTGSGVDPTLKAITTLAMEREKRRKNLEEMRRKKTIESFSMTQQGKFGDLDFVGMIDRYRATLAEATPYLNASTTRAKINVAVRKRPISERERALQDYDAVTCSNPLAVVHNCKFKVDGITKTLENTKFEFDFAFDEHATNDEVYEATCAPLIDHAVLQNGKSTVFAYGQTGSGKTYTMEGLQERAAKDIFDHHLPPGTRVKCSLFELYGAQCLDLLNERRACAVREDGFGEIHVDGLAEESVETREEFMACSARGASQRTTRSTEMNSDSSRSHAIFQISFPKGGKLSLIDLAGSERGQDTKQHDSTRRSESAMINKSLLALKECIRALDPNSGCSHVPYRGSKLTMILRDSFSDDSKTVMISCVSPAVSSSDHTLNTLRYADRVKEKATFSSSSSSSNTGHANLGFSAHTPKSPGVLRKSLVGANSNNNNSNNPPSRPKSPFNGGASRVPLDAPGAASRPKSPFRPTTNSFNANSRVSTSAQPSQPRSTSSVSPPDKVSQTNKTRHNPGQHQSVDVRKPSASMAASSSTAAARHRHPPPRTSPIDEENENVDDDNLRASASVPASSFSRNARSNPAEKGSSSSNSTHDVSSLSHASSSSTSRLLVSHLNREEDEEVVDGEFEEREEEEEEEPCDSSRESDSPPPPPASRRATPSLVTAKGASKTTSTSTPNLQSRRSAGSGVKPGVVSKLVDEEEAVIALHEDALEENLGILKEEQKLLRTVQSTAEFDVNEYLGDLDRLLAKKCEAAANLRSKIAAFKAHLKAEEEFAMI